MNANAQSSFARLAIHYTVARLISKFNFKTHLTMEEAIKDEVLRVFPKYHSKGLEMRVQVLC